MKSYHVKKGDTVKCISGDAKGKEGEVIALLEKNDRVVIRFSADVRAELKLGTRTVKKSNANPNGGKVDREYSTHVSNVAKTAAVAK